MTEQGPSNSARGPRRRTQAAAGSSQIRRRRNRFKLYGAPQKRMSSNFRPPTNQTWPDGPPGTVLSFVRWFENQENARERFRWALRDSLDELMDGQRTGRWSYDHLSKTEKAHLGTIVEVNLTKEFEIPDGIDLDWRIDGQDLDCKFSKDVCGWEIPMEMYRCADHGDRSGKKDHIALLVWMTDDTEEWAAGLLQISDSRLRWKVQSSDDQARRAYNRDNKRKISSDAFNEISWLWGGLQSDLPPNTLQGLDSAIRDRIFADAGSGQGRVNVLFRELQGKIIRRPTVLTVGQQDDAPKRARDARIKLKQEGIIVLGHQESHPKIAERFNLPQPAKGEWISIRLTSVLADDERPKVSMSGKFWAIARPDDPPQAAPDVPKVLPPQGL